MAANLEFLHPVFRDRVLATGADVVSGARSHERQQQLWDDYQAGRGNPANRPGTSWHEYDESVAWPPADGQSALVGGPWAMAVDFAEPYPHGAEGLCFPIPGEPWHAQPAQITESQRVDGAAERLPPPTVAPPAPPLDPYEIGDRHVLVLDNALQRVTIKTFANKVLDVDNASVSDGAKVQQWSPNGGAHQQFYVDPCGSRDYPDEVRLIAAHSGRVLDIAGNGGAGTQLIQWPWHGGANQRWRLEAAGSQVHIVSARNPKLVADVAQVSADDGAPVIVWAPNGGKQQSFVLATS